MIAKDLSHASNKENIRKEAQRICSETSDWLVPEQPPKPFIYGLVEVILVRAETITQTDIYEKLESKLSFTGLNTSLKPTFGLNTSRHCNKNKKSFLDALDRNFFNKALQHQLLKITY